MTVCLCQWAARRRRDSRVQRLPTQAARLRAFRRGRALKPPREGERRDEGGLSRSRKRCLGVRADPHTRVLHAVAYDVGPQMRALATLRAPAIARVASAEIATACRKDGLWSLPSGGRVAAADRRNPPAAPGAAYRPRRVGGSSSQHCLPPHALPASARGACTLWAAWRVLARDVAWEDCGGCRDANDELQVSVAESTGGGHPCCKPARCHIFIFGQTVCHPVAGRSWRVPLPWCRRGFLGEDRVAP